MAGAQFTPLDLSLIDEGRFMRQANRDLRELQTRMVKFLDTYKDKAKGAKGKLTIEVTVACEEPGDELFSVKSQIKKSVPASPASATIAMVAEDEEHQRCLFVRRSGSSRDNPAQGKFATEDGQTIDQKTYEVIEKEEA